jgi:hypothetical protein
MPWQIGKIGKLAERLLGYSQSLIIQLLVRHRHSATIGRMARQLAEWRGRALVAFVVNTSMNPTSMTIPANEEPLSRRDLLKGTMLGAASLGGSTTNRTSL